MKILHVCLANFYIDNYSYQENVLPKMHKKMGLEVRILASTETFVGGKKLGYLKPSTYINEYGIEVTRLPYVKWLLPKLARKLRIYPKVYEYLENYKPDIIFMHDVQFLSIKKIVKYAKNNPNVRIIADGHSDFSNSATNFISRHILHGIIYKKSIRKAEPYIERFYGVLPARVEFFKKVYGIPEQKVFFLPMGVDDDVAKKYGSEAAGLRVRKENGIDENDFLIVSGGKIDCWKKQTLLLMSAVNSIDNPKLKLLIFGSVVDELKDDFNSKLSDKIIYKDWATVSQSYEYFAAADVAIFPGRHSVYWEQSAGLGKPLIVKYWEGTTHVDLGGNVLFLYKDSEEEIKDALIKIMNDGDFFSEMKKNAQEKGRSFFSYLSIAERSIK